MPNNRPQSLEERFAASLEQYPDRFLFQMGIHRDGEPDLEFFRIDKVEQTVLVIDYRDVTQEQLDEWNIEDHKVLVPFAELSGRELSQLAETLEDNDGSYTDDDEPCDTPNSTYS